MCGSSEAFTTKAQRTQRCFEVDAIVLVAGYWNIGLLSSVIPAFLRLLHVCSVPMKALTL